MSLSYEQFLSAKVPRSPEQGFVVTPEDVNPMLTLPTTAHERDAVIWMLRGGRRAGFLAFGLGKTFIQLEIARLVQKHTGGRFLIAAPLGVRGEFFKDAKKLGIQIGFTNRIEDCDETGIYLTNYEPIRDGKLDPRLFAGASLDEASCLRGMGSTKTFREFMRLFDGMRYKFVATATPSPNDYIELLAYSAFLEIMDVGEAKTRFFKRNSEKAEELTIHPHKQREFWLWCASWALFLQRPSDLGYSDEGYDLPPMEIHWHEIPSDHSNAGEDPSGQRRLVKQAALGVVGASREKRDSLNDRVAKILELRALDQTAHRIIWHDLESERKALEAAIPGLPTVFGSQNMDKREEILRAFSDGEIQELGTKPSIAGSGSNFQRHCAWAIFSGIGFKFNDFIQSIYRIQRFLQTKTVRLDLIYTEAETQVKAVLLEKWEQHKLLMEEMSKLIRELGLAQASIASILSRSASVERCEFSGENWRAINNDSVYELRTMASDSAHLLLTSIPFATQYEYTPSYLDFGHTDSNAHFWEQMDYLTPELFRVLQPGRIAEIHVKDRIIPGGLKGLGFQTVYPFHADAIAHFQKHGFAYLGMKTIVTDVVRENNQTYRLGWTEQCKDGSRMGFGMPEYLLLFRKPPTDSSNGYADVPVIKNKGQYSRSRWQIDAHGYARSSGNRLLSPADLNGLTHAEIFQRFRRYSRENVYDFEQHVALGESLERCQRCDHIHTGRKTCGGSCECSTPASRLPLTFMLLQPESWSDDVWTDVTRMLSLNGAQSASGREMHLCPMQFDIADRAITQYTQPGEIVLDPFGGLMTVPYRAVLLGRKGIGIELNPRYVADGVQYLKAAEQKINTPTLFDMFGADPVEPTNGHVPFSDLMGAAMRDADEDAERVLRGAGAESGGEE